jgi:hypothetical protein
MSKSKIGKPTWNKGIKMSEETKIKQCATRVGKPTWNKGIKYSKEICEKFSIAQKLRYTNLKWKNL